MKIFCLPDLGEGLDEAELREWHVGPGDRVVADQPLLSVETAKAVVEIPAPYAGRIVRVHGEPGQILRVGAPIVEFECGEELSGDSGTVVGVLPTLPVASGASEETGSNRRVDRRPPTKASPAIRKLARTLGLDIAKVTGTGPDGTVTRADLDRVGSISGYEPLKGVRRAMAENMARSALEVPSSTVSDEVIISHWPAQTDFTVQFIRAIVAACIAEPSLNAWFDRQRMACKKHSTVDLGIALNSAAGLFVPVIRDAANHSDAELREMLDTYKIKVRQRQLSPSELTGQTITLSNFGMLGGLYASLAIVPPQVGIVGVGRAFDGIRPVNGIAQIVKVLPISLTFDHRTVTGAEAVRFLVAFTNWLAMHPTVQS